MKDWRADNGEAIWSSDQSLDCNTLPTFKAGSTASIKFESDPSGWWRGDTLDTPDYRKSKWRLPLGCEIAFGPPIRSFRVVNFRDE